MPKFGAQDAQTKARTAWRQQKLKVDQIEGARETPGDTTAEFL